MSRTQMRPAKSRRKTISPKEAEKRMMTTMGMRARTLSMLLASALLALFLLSQQGSAISQPAYTYDSFQSEIEVFGDGMVKVRDKVTYSFTDNSGWVGISIPAYYGKVTEGRVLASDGSELPTELWEHEQDENGYTLWCLVEDAGPSATFIYEYVLQGALQRNGDMVGLAGWSAVPTQRSSAIDHTSTTIKLPAGLEDSEIDLDVTPLSYGGEITTRIQGGSTAVIEADWLDASSYYMFDCFWPSRVMDLSGSGFTGDTAAVKSWEFERFDVDITLHPDSTYTVRETQVVNFHGSFSWLNRDLSTRSAYFGEGRTYGRVRVRDVAVFNLDGTPYDAGSWSVEGEQGIKRVRIEFEAQDEQRGWIIEYRMSGAFIFAEDYDRLYWNAVSIDRDVPIKSSSISVHLPPGTEMGYVQSTQYVDIYSPPSTYEAGVEGNSLWWSVKDIAPHTTFTIDISLPKGTVNVPWQYGRACGIGVIAFSGTAFTAVLLIMLLLWWRKGRDIGRTGTSMVRYDPPEGLTPAMVGMLVHEEPRVEDITATIVDLARRGYLRIMELEKRSLIRVTNYGFKRLKDVTPDLLPYEKAIMDGLFSSGDYVEEKDLKDKFYVHVPKILDGVRDEVMSRKLFERDPRRVRRMYYVAGSLVAVLPPAAAIISPFWFDIGWFNVLLFSFLLVGAVVMLFGRFMPRRSSEGSRLYEHVRGYREFMATAEGEELEKMTPEDFQTNLPYAMVLGVSDAWARKFRDIYTTPPEWFSGATTTFSTVYLASSLGTMTDRLNSTLTSSPSSSGGEGVGGGGFGGGFSGGGFGGGGSSAG